jgi:DNA-binding MarR family transcriptional regulator
MTEPSSVPALAPGRSAPDGASAAARRTPPRDRPRPDPAGERLDAWRAFLVAHSLVTRRLDEELRAAGGPTLAEYDALVQLSGADGGRLRMNELADRVLLSRSGVTRLVDRLVADGLVARVSCPSDARGSMAALTDRGRAALREAARTHLHGVERYFTTPLNDEDVGALRHALDAVIDASAAGTAHERCSAHGPGEDRPAG